VIDIPSKIEFMLFVYSFQMYFLLEGHTPPHLLSPIRGGGIAYLNDPDSFAGWTFYTPGRASQARQVEG